MARDGPKMGSKRAASRFDELQGGGGPPRCPVVPFGGLVWSFRALLGLSWGLLSFAFGVLGGALGLDFGGMWGELRINMCRNECKTILFTGSRAEQSWQNGVWEPEVRTRTF